MYQRTIIMLFFLTGTTVFCKGNVLNPLMVIDTNKVELPVQLSFPNKEWRLAINKSPAQFIYKRSPITDSKGNSVIPAVMIYTEDASGYNKDVGLFWGQKMQPLTDKGVKTTEVLTWQNKKYPLSITNGILVTGTYTANDVAHIIYMVYIIDKHDKGIQIYLDMTTEVQASYGNEFWDVIRSIRELK